MLSITLFALLAFQGLPDHPSKIELPAITELAPAVPTRAESGGAVLLLLEDHSLPLVDGILTFQAGSLREPARLTGLAELWATGLREGGSSSLTGQEFNAWLDAHAVQFAVSSTEDQLRITFNCLSADLDQLLQHISAICKAPAFEESAIEVARGQMLTAIDRANDDGAALADAAMDRALYGERSPFGRRPTSASVSAISRADLLAFTKANFAKDRMILGLSGSFDSAKAQAAFEANFKDLPKLGPAPDLPKPSFNAIDHSKIYIVDRPGVTQTELRIGGRGLAADSPDRAAMTLWTYVVGAGGMTNRMMNRVRTELGLAYGVGTGFASQMDRTGEFFGYCATRNDAASEALSEMLEIIMDSGADLFPKDELEAARKRLLAGQVFRIDSAAKNLERALRLEFYNKPANFYTQNLKRLRATDSEQIIRAVRRHLPPGRFLCVAVGPADEITKSLSTIAEVILVKEAETLFDSTQALDKLFAAIGGREAWAAINGIHIKQLSTVHFETGDAQIPVEQWRRFAPLSVRLKQRTPSALTYTNVITETGGWMRGPTGLSQVPPEQVGTWQTSMNQWMYYNLHLIAKGDGSRSTGLDSQGRIVLLDGLGRMGWIELDDDHRPAALGVGQPGSEKVYNYSNWTQAGPIFFAKRFTESGKSTEIELFEASEEIDDSLFDLPTPL